MMYRMMVNLKYQDRIKELFYEHDVEHVRDAQNVQNEVFSSENSKDVWFLNTVLCGPLLWWTVKGVRFMGESNYFGWKKKIFLSSIKSLSESYMSVLELDPVTFFHTNVVTLTMLQTNCSSAQLAGNKLSVKFTFSWCVQSMEILEYDMFIH